MRTPGLTLAGFTAIHGLNRKCQRIFHEECRLNRSTFAPRANLQHDRISIFQIAARTCLAFPMRRALSHADLRAVLNHLSTANITTRNNVLVDQCIPLGDASHCFNFRERSGPRAIIRSAMPRRRPVIPHLCPKSSFSAANAYAGSTCLYFTSTLRNFAFCLLLHKCSERVRSPHGLLGVFLLHPHEMLDNSRVSWRAFENYQPFCARLYPFLPIIPRCPAQDAPLLAATYV
jgi:hypothetical protein